MRNRGNAGPAAVRLRLELTACLFQPSQRHIIVVVKMRLTLGVVVMTTLSWGCVLSRGGVNSDGEGAGGTVAGTGGATGGSGGTASGSGGTASGSGGMASGSGGMGTGGMGTGGTGGQPVVCNGTDEYLGGPMSHCYKVYGASEKTNWDAARTECQSWGGDLAAISSQAELDFIATFIATGDQDHWLGGYDASPPMGLWAWSNGETWGVNGWGATPSMFPWKNGEPASQPNVKVKDGEFETKAESHEAGQGYICEK